MEAWTPLFNIFLNSSTPEADASIWLQHSFDASATIPITTNSFLSLLLKPSVAIAIDSSSSPLKRVMRIQTLPNAVQSRILSFLAYDNRRFCTRDLSVLATNILKGNLELDFWVKNAAHNLLDVVSNSHFDSVSGLNSCSKERVEEEFEALPIWLQSMTKTSTMDRLLPWLPLSPDELNSRISVGSFVEENRCEDLMVEEEDENEEEGEIQMAAEFDMGSPVDPLLDPEIQRKAACLKAQLLTFESTSKTVGLANEIRQLCFDRGGQQGDPFTILGLIEPWEADDETTSILVSNLSGGSEEDNFSWSSQILCSVILPKLLVLREPASRVLVTSTVEYCKLHQRAAVDALLFPLILCKEGINTPICDVVTKIIRECLHPAHVSSFCQKLLCGEEEVKRFVCLPCHKYLIYNELVWTEPLFTLFQNILNQNVHLTQDSVDQLVYEVQEFAGRFSKSLKFGNFLLCLVTKCAPLLKSHKFLLTEVVELTNTFMTKSILSKLSSI